MTPKIAVVGDLVLDILLWECRRLGPALVCSESHVDAGGSSNILITLSRLGEKALAVGAVGSDDPGSLVLEALENESVDTRLVERVEGRTSVIVMTEFEDRIEYRAFIGRMLGETMPPIEWSRLDAVVLNGNTLSDPSSHEVFKRILRESSRETLTLLNLGFGALAGNAILEGAGEKFVLVCNLDEARILTGSSNPREAAEKLLGKASTVVVTMGKRGCLVARKGRDPLVIPARSIPAPPHREVGAGDVFTAVLSSCLARMGLEEVEACCKVASLAAELKIREGLTGRRLPGSESLGVLLRWF